MRTDIGHIAIEVGEQRWEFIPSFKNMRSICEPEQLPDLFATLFGAGFDSLLKTPVKGGLLNNLAIYESRRVCSIAALVMQCCCDDDVTPLTGRIVWERGPNVVRTGYLTPNAMIHVARVLMSHGIIGKFESAEGKKQKQDKRDKVDVYEFVEIAAMHLDIPMSDAENLTKTEFDRLLAAKYPKQKDKAPSDEQYHETMDWLDKVNAARVN